MFLTMSEKDQDEFFMRQALAGAAKALEAGEVPIGAVVVGGGRILGRGHNLVESLADATAHAEMQAITASTHTIGGKYLADCTLYVTLEPCVMCAGACAWSQVGRIVWGASDPKRGFLKYGGAALLHPRTTTQAGVLEAECSELLERFFASLRK